MTEGGSPEMIAKEIAGLSYEAALGELDRIIERLEHGTVALEEAITAYERGAALAQHCAGLLDRTEQKISQLVVGAGGRVGEKLLETEAPRAAEPDLPLSPLAPVRRQERLPVDPDEIPF